MSMASILIRLTLPTFKPALFPRRLPPGPTTPRYLSHIPSCQNASTPTTTPITTPTTTTATATSTDAPPPSASTPQDPEDEGDPMVIEEKEWDFDDFTSDGHAELERHREARQYARIAMYEMPQLSALSKPFTPPTAAQVLRFRYTTYLGEQHPAGSKVVVEFSPYGIPLTPVQRDKLIKLLGVRYNPGTGVAKISTEMFEMQAQNKRYLSDLVDRLVAEARDPTDDFSDVPVDYRHYTARLKPPTPRFPSRWRMNEKRREGLAESREKFAKLFEGTGTGASA